MSDIFRTRKNINSLSEPELKKLRDALQFLYDLPNDDDRGYWYWGGIHGFPLEKCWHSPEDIDGWPQVHLFLPWHRAYLYDFEKQLQDIDPDVTIPYWDWRTPSNKIGIIPKAFDQKVVNNKPNPLYEYKINFPNHSENHTTSREPGFQGRRLPTTERIENLLDSRNHFEEFSESLRNFHNGVHMWVGGDMTDQRYAAFDFIFHSHHAFVDNLWFKWQKRNDLNNIPQYYLDMVLEPFGYTVKQMLDPFLLGYEYAEEDVVIIEEV